MNEYYKSTFLSTCSIHFVKVGLDNQFRGGEWSYVKSVSSWQLIAPKLAEKAYREAYPSLAEMPPAKTSRASMKSLI
jgi:hypothetical protein